MKRITLALFVLSIIIHLSFLVSLSLGFWNPFFNDSAPDMKGRGADFFVFYSSAKYLGEGKNIYSPGSHSSVPYAYSPYAYLPHLILITGIPLTFFSPWTAYGLWVALMEGLLLGCAYITYLMAKKFQYPYPWLGAALWLAFTPAYPDFYMGQIGTLVTFCLMLMLWGHLQEKNFLSYWGWTFSVFFKTVTLPLAFGFLRQKKWRWVLLTLTLSFLPFLIYLAFYGQGPLLQYYQIRSHRIPRAYAGSPNFLVLLDLWGASTNAIFIIKFFIVGLGFILFLAKEVDAADIWALWMASFFLIYNSVWEHHYLMLLPFLAYYLLRQKDPWLWGIYLCLALPTPYIFYREKKIYDGIYYCSKVIPTIAFYFYTLRRHLQAPTRWLYFDHALKRIGERI